MRFTATLFILTYAIYERLIQGLLGTVSCINIAMPEKPDSVLPYRNNEAATGKYTFYFKVSSSVPSNPFITIDFPSTYPKIVQDIDKCSGRIEVLLRSEKFYMDCTVFGSQIIFDLGSKWSELDAGNIIIELFDVVNPSTIQDRSSGNFAIRTWSGLDIPIDTNMIFDAIGFAPQYTGFTSVSVVNDGANIAGYITNYVVQFQNVIDYPVGTWFRLKFPPGFAFQENIDCYVEGLPDDKAQLPCYQDE